MGSEDTRAHTVATCEDEGSSLSFEELESGKRRKVAIVGVDFCVFEGELLRIVMSGHTDSHFVDIFVFLNLEGLKSLLASSEVGWLVHVQPDARKLNLPVKPVEVPLPVFGCIGMQKVDIVDLSGPYFPPVELPISGALPQKYLHRFAPLGWDAVRNSHGHIHQGH